MYGLTIWIYKTLVFELFVLGGPIALNTFVPSDAYDWLIIKQPMFEE